MLREESLHSELARPECESKTLPPRQLGGSGHATLLAPCVLLRMRGMVMLGVCLTELLGLSE